MLALRLHGPADLRLDEVPTPEASPITAIIRVEACGLCGSDVHFADGSARTDHVPITLGHEIAGRIVTDPTGNHQPDTEVVVEVGIPCLVCERCVEARPNLCERIQVLGIDIDGGFAEFVAVPVESVIPRPAGVPAASAATAADAGATALHAIERRARVTDGETVLIIGAGGLGSYGIQWAQRAGAGAVIVADTDGRALESARKLGVDETVLVEPGKSLGRHVKLLSDGGVDAAIEFVGAATTVDAAVKSIRPGGRAVAVGVGMDPLVSLPIVLWSNNEYTLLGSYGSLPGDTLRVLQALSTGSVVAPQTVDVPLVDGVSMLESLAAGDGNAAARPVIRP